MTDQDDVPCGPWCWLAFGNADNPIPDRPHECTYLGLHADGTRWTAEPEETTDGE